MTKVRNVTKVRNKGGRPKGSRNKSKLQNAGIQRRLEKVLVEKALAGDIDAIKACFDILGRRVEPRRAGRMAATV